MMLPRFQRLLATLQDPDKPPTAAQLAEASKVRKRLTDSFTQYDVAARRIRDMPTDSSTQKRLQEQLYGSASTFLHVHMLPLKSLPKILKHASPNGATTGVATTAKTRISFLREEDESSQTSSRLSNLETEESQLRQELMVLEEQKFMVGEMVADAQRRRKFEEVESLGRNVADLDAEIMRVQGMLESVSHEVRGVYLSPP